MGSAQRAPGREHIPEYPRGFIVLRVLQLVITIIVLGITAYTMAVVAFVSNSLMTFTVRSQIVYEPPLFIRRELLVSDC